MLTTDIERYLALRRALGFKLEKTAEYLESFARFAEARGERHIRAQSAIEWAQMAPTPDSRYRRLRDVARAARFLRAENPAHEIPPASLFAKSRNKLIPYIFTPDDLTRLLEAAAALHRHERYPVQRQRYAMLFGLIAATGLRITEALDLRHGDVLSGGVLRIRETKFGKSRLVPLHPTVQEALDRYLTLRHDFVGLVDCLFLQGGEGSATPSRIGRSATSSGLPISHRDEPDGHASTICAIPSRHGFWSNVAPGGKSSRGMLSR